MRKRYKYVVYTKLIGEDDWMFVTKDKEFRTKTEAIEYLIQRSEEEIENYRLQLDEITVNGLEFTNHKIGGTTWIQAEEI